MQCANEDDLVATLQYVVALAFELPVSVVDQDENPRSSAQSRRQCSNHVADGCTELTLSLHR